MKHLKYTVIINNKPLNLTNQHDKYLRLQSTFKTQITSTSHVKDSRSTIKIEATSSKLIDSPLSCKN